MKYLSAILLFVLALPLYAAAQTTAATAPRAAEIFATSSTPVVKGAPFSAEGISESVQTLADGNRITRSSTTKMYRDSEGRFRREGSSAASGGGTHVFTTGTLASAVGFQDTISIFDPVGNVRYLISDSAKTVRKMNTRPGAAEGAVIVNGMTLSPAIRAQIETNAAQKSQVVVLPSLATTTVRTTGLATAPGGVFSHHKGTVESLGTRNFEGVEAEGTRTTTVIAAGAIGNEREIEIVYELWYSKELQMIVSSRHSDPRFGEQTYRLVNISRSEPDRSLFQPPAGYKVVAEPRFNVVTAPKAQ